MYCREREDRKFYFPCNQWLAKDEGDGQIVRHLAATTDSSAAFEGDYIHAFYLVNRIEYNEGGHENEQEMNLGSLTSH